MRVRTLGILSLVCGVLALAPWMPRTSHSAAAAGSPGTIAYTTGDEIHLINADGSGDRRIWTNPSPSNGGVDSLVWKPDASEIAFSSSHEAPFSFFQADIYAIRPDGGGFRKVTNAPDMSTFAALPKGTVTVTVRNAYTGGGPFFVYVAGATAGQAVTVGGGASQTLTFNNVADFGPGVSQPVVAINGLYRWFTAGVAPDVQPGQTVNAGTLSIFGNGIRSFGARKPTWRSDGSRIGFVLGAGCSLDQVDANPPNGLNWQTLLNPNVSGFTCNLDWAPLASIANQIVYDDYGVEGHIWRTQEGSSDAGTQLVSYDGSNLVWWLKWLPDASGVLLSLKEGFDDANIYEYDFATQAVTQITHFTSEFAGVFSISPDGQYIVFERSTSPDNTPDLWIMRRDGSEMRLLVRGAARPSWSPRQPLILSNKLFVPLVRR